MSRRLLVAVCLLGLFAAVPAYAVIMVLIPLNDVVEKEQFIFIARVAEILPDKPALVLVPDEHLKGKAPFERMPINLTGDAEAKKEKHTDILLDRVDKDLPIVIIASKRGNKYIAFGFTNGTWFQMDGRIEKQDDKEVVRWSFLHCEPYLRRTFKGTTEELKQIVADAVAKKKAPPAPEKEEPPGFGPAIKKKSSNDPSRSFYPFAVVQLPFIGLIAALAALFPTVFGGLAIFMKRWVAVLSTGGFVSMFVTFPMIAPAWSANLKCYSPSGLWWSCAILFGLGALWAVRRYRRSLDTGAGEVMQPRKFDRLFLGLFFLAGATALLIGRWFELPLLTNTYRRWVLAGTLAIGAGTWYLVSVYLRKQPAPLRVSGETVLLWTLAASCLAFGAWEAGKYSKQGINNGGGGAGRPSLNTEVLWKFEPKLGGYVVNTCATPERLFVAVMAIDGLTGSFGRVYALDPETGAEQWQFDNDYENDPDLGMKPAFSGPVFADGRLYFGEGLHTNKDSRLFCLDAATGKKLWDYRTESHTEATPFIAEGKVVIGAGYHGVHCLDAVNGPGPNNQPLWRYPPNAKAADESEHVDCNPVIANGLVYAGSGYKPSKVSAEKINKIFCLNLNDGSVKWQERTDDAIFGSPFVHDGNVFYGAGNSTFSEKHPSKRPGVMCRNAETGAVVWDRVLPDGVIARSVADKYQLFVGCMDGKAYALDLRTGQVNWKIDALGPIHAGPILDADQENGVATVVYIASKHGQITAVDPYSGKAFWSAPVSAWTQQAVEDLSASPTFLRKENDKELRRRLYLGFGQGQTGSVVPRLICIEDVTKKTDE